MSLCKAIKTQGYTNEEHGAMPATRIKKLTLCEVKPVYQIREAKPTYKTHSNYKSNENARI